MAEDENNEPMADEELDPTVEPKSSRAWLAIIAKAEKVFDDYQNRSDNIDRLYANLERLAKPERDREFSMFWANIQVLGPSIYSRPPIPVVVPRFKDQRPLARTTSELLERSCIVTFQLEDIDSVMRLVRDDLAILARGCIWLRYETKAKNDGVAERVCIEHKDRKDFLHEPARNWKEVGWVGNRAWMTKDEATKRFGKKLAAQMAYEVRRDGKDGEKDSDDGIVKCGVWEIWSKTHNTVVWVTEGVEELLDEGEPHLTLEDFFPCPRPAYGTVQRRSLVPVPDYAQYKDQLEEINELTGRFGALCQALKLKGFYPSGSGELGDAIEAAIKAADNNVVLIPVSNWALLGGTAPKDMIVWLPIDMVATVITQVIEVRRQLIDDVYQITGLSDIMRGSTVASETLGAQQLKSQYGSIRIRDRQDELIRIARDVTRIAAEIMAENFQSKTLLDMSQMDIPTDAQIAKQVKPLEAQIQQITQQVEKAKADPQLQQQAQQNPDQAKQMLQKAQEQADQLGQQINKLQSQPTVEKITKFLRDQRLRPFVLDIETDSTIAPDEDAQKQRATEYITAMGGFLTQAVTAIQEMPEIAPLMADAMKFVQSQFRVGRVMDESVEEFVDAMKKRAGQPKPPDPAAMKAEADAKATQTQQQMDMQTAQVEAQMKQADMQIRMQEAKTKAETAQADLAIKQQTAAHDAQVKAHDLEVRKQEAAISLQSAQIDAQAKMQTMEAERQKLPLEIQKILAEIEKIRAGTTAAEVGAQATAVGAQVQVDTAKAKTDQMKKEPA